jgi:hypothetical protein
VAPASLRLLPRMSPLVYFYKRENTAKSLTP